MSWLSASKTKLGTGFALLREFFDLPVMAMALVPYKDRRFIDNYIGTIKAIHEGDRVKIYQQRLMQLIMVLAVILFTIVLSLPNKSEWTMLVFFDFVTILHYPLTLCYEMLGIIFLVIFFLEQLYFTVYDKYFVVILLDIYFARNKAFIFNNPKPIVWWMVTVLQCYQVFVVLLDLFAIYMYLEYLPPLLQYHPFESMVGMIGLLNFHIFYGGTMLVLVVFLHVGMLASTVAFLVNLCFSIRMDESYARYIKPSVDHLTSLRLLRYFRCNVHTMKFLLSLNGTYGPLLLFFLVTNVPINSSLLNAILLGRLNRLLAFFSFGFVVGQLTAIFVFHVCTTRFTKKLHAPMNEIIGKYVKMPRCSLRAQLRTALNIETFKTKKKYGITYGSFGLISMSAFCKFMFFYSELILNGFKEAAHNSQ